MPLIWDRLMVAAGSAGGFQASFLRATLSSSSWGTPRCSQARQDTESLQRVLGPPWGLWLEGRVAAAYRRAVFSVFFKCVFLLFFLMFFFFTNLIRLRSSKDVQLVRWVIHILFTLRLKNTFDDPFRHGSIAGHSRLLPNERLQIPQELRRRRRGCRAGRYDVSLIRWKSSQHWPGCRRSTGSAAWCASQRPGDQHGYMECKDHVCSRKGSHNSGGNEEVQTISPWSVWNQVGPVRAGQVGERAVHILDSRMTLHHAQRGWDSFFPQLRGPLSVRKQSTQGL